MGTDLGQTANQVNFVASRWRDLAWVRRANRVFRALAATCAVWLGLAALISGLSSTIATVGLGISAVGSFFLGRRLEKLQDKRQNELEEKLAAQRPRQVNKQTAMIIRKFLLAHGRQAIRVTSLYGDAEGTKFAGQLTSVIAAAGWSTSGPDPIVFSKTPKGLRIHIRQDADSDAIDAGKVLCVALQEAGFQTEARWAPDGQEEDVLLLVGHKP